jgi:hypothetical protein
MAQPEFQRGWLGSLTATIVLLAILCAMTAAVIHVHPPSEDLGESHCALCLLGATMVALVTVVALTISWRRTFLMPLPSPMRIQCIRLSIQSIRPPPPPGASGFLALSHKG